MGSMTSSLALLVLALPLVSGLLAGFFGAKLREGCSRVAVPALAGAFFGAVGVLVGVVWEGPTRVTLYPFLDTAREAFPFELYLDRLSAVMMVLITGVSTVVHVFSVRYLSGDSGYTRFFMLLGLITFVLLCLVSSANLLMLFMFWSLLSWLLYLLLAYNYQYRPAYEAAFKTLLAHRIGDVAFLSGLLLAYGLFGTLDFTTLFARAAASPVEISFGPVELDGVTLMTLLIFVGAMAKSAQFPLHVWLPDTMDTPTPVSALMHAGIVNAGGFLLNRLAPLYGLSTPTLHTVFVVGGITLLIGATMMLTQPDVKKTLGFSTMGQMGYMIMECGLGAFALAIFHLIAHGLFKATLFLGAGQAIHSARRTPILPPAFTPQPDRPFSQVTWVTGFTMTLLLPLAILLAVHGILDIPLRNKQGAVIFLFFGWVTASQALFSLFRINALTSWIGAATMILTLILIGFTYLWAAETFMYFLYPDPAVVARYFHAAALPTWLFDLLVVVTAALIIGAWFLLYANARGQHILMPNWIPGVLRRIYVLVMNRLYIEAVYARLSRGILQVAARIDRIV